MSIKIKPSNRGKLTDLAKSEGAYKDGKISVKWMRSKLNNPKTSEKIRKRIQFALNAREWD